MIKNRSWLRVLLLCTVFTGFGLGGSQVGAGSPYQDEISNKYFPQMPKRLPDDSYNLIKNGTIVSDITSCFNINKPDPNRCIAGGYNPDADSHQYFTITGSSNINDPGGAPGGGGLYNTLFIAVYTQIQRDVDLTYSPVNRRRTALQGCEGRVIVTQELTETPKLLNLNKDDCGRSRSVSIDSRAFQPYIIKDGNGNDVDTGLWRAYINISTTDLWQNSFHIGVDSYSALGYRGEIDSNGNDTGAKYINQYPTALADRHTISFKWRPPCTAIGKSATPWYDDINYPGNSAIQRLQPSFTVYRYNPTTPSSPSFVGSRVPVTDSSTGPTFTISSYGSKQTYAYLYKFDNFDGGNGIGFEYPYDSADSFIPCPSVTDNGWRLNNSTERNYGSVKVDVPPKPTGRFYADGVNCNNATYKADCRAWQTYYNNLESAVKAALNKVEFRHYVKNYDANGKLYQVAALNARHFTRKQYMYDLVNGRGSSGYISDVNSWSTNIGVGQQVEVGLSRSPVISTSNSKYRQLFRNFQNGDRYCERAQTYNYPTSTGGSPVVNGGLCVVLTTDDVVCYPSWFLANIGSSAPRIAGDGGDKNDAWVGSTYQFIAYATSYGPGSPGTRLNGNPLNFRGYWEGEYAPVFNVQASDGGRVVNNPFTFEPTWYDNSSCSGGGTFSQSQQVVVPYYYHLPSEMVPTPSLKDKIDQGSSINVAGKITLPDKDSDVSPRAAGDRNDGRKHTYTESDREHQWRLLSFAVDDKAQAQTAFGIAPRDSSAPCNTGNGITTFGMAGARDCNVIKSGQHRFDSIGIFDINGDFQVSPTTPVGTVICFTVAVEKPRDNLGWDTWRYAPPVCTTVIKSPKVQFRYGDVNTGRPRIGVGNCEVNTAAKIQATSAPNVATVGVADNFKYQYGSWGEYGVFSSGTITAFGSSGAEASTTDKAKRLTFANTQNPYGSYPYNIKCIPNLMNGFTAEDNIGTDTVYPNEYFTDATNSRNTKSRFVRAGNIKLETRPDKTYQARIKLKGYSDCGNDTPGGPLTPAKVGVTVYPVSGPAVTDNTIEMTSCTTSPIEITKQLDLGGSGWSGIRRVDVKFLNNNHNAQWDTDNTNMKDRNLFLSNIQVDWIRNGTDVIASTPYMNATDGRVLRTNPDDYYGSNPNPPCTQTNTDGRWWVGGDAFSDGRLAIPSTYGDKGYQYGHCYGVHIDNFPSINSAFGNQEVPPPVLGSGYDNFKGRNIIVYAKDGDNNCANNNGGNLEINTNLDYKPDGYAKLSDIPRFTLMADCNITISDSVNMVRASLIAGKEIQTCKQVAKSQDACNKKLTIKGAIQAKSLSLWRTSGADLTNKGDASIAAETFEYGVDQMMAGYEYGLVNPVLKPVYQRDLPPRY